MQLWKVPRKTPLLTYINEEFVAIKRNCLDGTPVASDCLSLTGPGLADSRLNSPLDPSALLREVPLPLFFCGAPPAARGLAGLLFQNLLQTYINKMMWYKDKDRATGGIVQGH